MIESNRVVRAIRAEQPQLQECRVVVDSPADVTAGENAGSSLAPSRLDSSASPVSCVECNAEVEDTPVMCCTVCGAKRSDARGLIALRVLVAFAFSRRLVIHYQWPYALFRPTQFCTQMTIILITLPSIFSASGLEFIPLTQRYESMNKYSETVKIS